MKIVKCQGEGQGSCKRCTDNGKWNRIWMCFLSKIEGYEGCYCNDCVKAIQAESEVSQQSLQAYGFNNRHNSTSCEEVYDCGYDTAGNYHMYGSFSGHTVIKSK